ncbi:MAG: DUF4062 domain-containing protein [Ignavibacteriae bacterium]|nr:DUF4062 domain-containing protein [Ignavibacteriota bacterium]
MSNYKPKIFISSTIKDMPNERIAALDAIKQIGGEPIMSEFTFTAQASDSVSLCLDYVKTSDIYVLIISGKFGWQPFGKESITELEFNTAQNNNIPIIVFNTKYDKEDKQKEFTNKVGALYYWKEVNHAFELKDELIESLKLELEKQKNNSNTKTEVIYSNLINLSIPKQLYIADLDIDREEIICKSKSNKKWLKKDANWFDVVVSALHQKEIVFPRDWTIFKKQIITFHDLSEDNLPLTKICDSGTVTPIDCEEFYEQSLDHLSVFKTLLAKCLQTKLYKLNIRWYKNDKLFAFLPVSKNEQGKWINRKIEWTKIKKNSRTVTKTTYSTKDPDKISSTRHLAFKTQFHFLDDKWFISIKPDWFLTWGDFHPNKYGYEKIQYIKKKERNIHVFNHLNFILWYLQPDKTIELFKEYREYKFLKIVDFVKFETNATFDDESWRKLESKTNSNKLNDKNGIIDLFIK